MAVESTTNINGLNEGAPLGEDSKSEGDNHIRLLKVALRATFPGYSGRYNRLVNKGSNYTLVLTDNGSTLRFTAGATLSGNPTAIGNGFSALLINDSTSTLVVDPTGTAQVNGKETLNIQKKSAAIVLCDGTAFYVIGVAYPTNGVSYGSEFGAGTRMLFQQSSPPLGWTLITDAAYNNTALRIIGEGSVTTGGVNTFSSVFNSTYTSDGHVLTTSEIPAHGHTGSGTTGTAGNHSHTASINVRSSSDGQGWKSAAQAVYGNSSITAGNAGVSVTAAGSHSHSFTFATNNTGDGQAHTHGFTANLKYVDFILAEKQ